MWSRVYEKVWCLFVCLSQHRPTAANPLLQAGDIDWLFQQWHAAGKCRQCMHMRQLNTDFFHKKSLWSICPSRNNPAILWNNYLSFVLFREVHVWRFLISVFQCNTVLRTSRYGCSFTDWCSAVWLLSNFFDHSLIHCEGEEWTVDNRAWVSRWSAKSVGRRVITQVREQSAHVTGVTETLAD